MLKLERETAASTNFHSEALFTRDALILITQHAPFSRKALFWVVFSRLRTAKKPDDELG